MRRNYIIRTLVVIYVFLIQAIGYSQSEYDQDAISVCSQIRDSYANISFKESIFGFNWDSICNEMLYKAKKIDNDKDFYLLMNRTLSVMQDGHLRFRYANGAVRNNILSYPDHVIQLLGLRWIENKAIIVSAPDNLHILGQELLSINGISIDSILNKLNQIYCLRGIPDHNKSQLLVYNRFWDYFDLFEDGFPDKIILTISDSSQNSKVNFSIEDFQSNQKSISGIRFGLPTENPNYSASYLKNNLALLTIPTFNVDMQAFCTFLDEFAGSCEKQGTKGLIIDLRYNAGGNESFRDLLAYLTSDTIDIVYYRYRLSESFFNDFPGRLVNERKTRKIVAQSSDKDYSEWFAWQIIPAANNYFTRIPVVIISNENIFSSTGNLLYAIKKYNLAKILGTDISLTGHGLGKLNLLPQDRFAFQNCYFESLGIDFEPLENQVMLPDIYTAPTIKSVQDTNDILLNRAINELSPVVR